MLSEAQASAFAYVIFPGLSLQTQYRYGAFRCVQPNVTRPLTPRRRRYRCAMTAAHTSAETAVAANTNNKWSGMTLHFVNLEVSRDGRNSKELNDYILRRLAQDGDPVRWAIVAADEQKGTCYIEAVVSRYEQR